MVRDLKNRIRRNLKKKSIRCSIKQLCKIFVSVGFEHNNQDQDRI